MRGVPLGAAFPKKAGNMPSRAIAAGRSPWHMTQPFRAPSALIAPKAAIAVPAFVPAKVSTNRAKGAGEAAVNAAGSIRTTAEQTNM